MGTNKNVNLIAIGSLIIGNNLPIADNGQKKVKEKEVLEAAAAEEQAVNAVAEGVEETEPAAEQAEAVEQKPCQVKKILRRVLGVIVLVLVIRLLCRCKGKEEEEELEEV
ncbi:MAG: hypothetical protein GX060_00655 [Firmicutes bacterium]|nr:hypothetical protein [Bacillota bacterium]